MRKRVEIVDRKEVLPVVMPLYDRHTCLHHSLATIGKWKIQIKLFFFQDGLPSNACPDQAGRHSKVRSVASKLCSDLGIPFEYSLRDKHLGLRKNIFNSVSQIFETYRGLFCVEDDVCVSPTFPEFCTHQLTQHHASIINANRFSTRDPGNY